MICGDGGGSGGGDQWTDLERLDSEYMEVWVDPSGPRDLKVDCNNVDHHLTPEENPWWKT